MSNLEIGDRIRDLRETQHYTRETLAEMCGISAKFLYEIEVGKKGFSAYTLCRMSEALLVSCDYIMFGEEKGYRGAEKILGVLKMLGPKQVSRMHDIVKILCEMCDSL